MKRIEFSRQFEKMYKKRIVRNVKLRAQFKDRYRMFVAGERGYPLNDHALTGNLLGRRAWSVANDLRVIYRETEDAIIFLDIGSHSQVYR